MRVIKPKHMLEAPVEHGRAAIQLHGDVAYVMHDVEASSGLQAGVLDVDDALPAPPVCISSDHLDEGMRLVMPFIGGLGDALSSLPVLAELKRRRPGRTVHVTTTPGPSELFAMSDIVDELLPYPLTLDEWRGFDCFYSLEAVHRTGQEAGRPLPHIFADAVGLELADLRFDLRIPGADRPQGSGTNHPPIIGVAVPDQASPRAYPAELLHAILDGLRARGFASVLLGNQSSAWAVDEDPPMVTDLRSRTPRLLELATWLLNMDVVIAHDSFIMHLAGALGRSTIVMSGPTSTAHGAVYPGVRAASSKAECAPCHAAVGSCPLGHPACIAWDREHFDADRVLAAVDVLVRELNGIDIAQSASW
jgi:ADP-heptose:LPS heptosyltransferase